MTQTEIKYVAEQIKKNISAIENEHFQWSQNTENNIKEEYPGWTEDWLQYKIRDTYYLILAYIEGKGMIQFLETFKSKLSLIIADEKKIMKTSLYDPEGFHCELDVIYNFKQFLDAFKFFDYQQTDEDEITKLTSILKNTDFIVKNCNICIEGEADIYKQVKWVLSLYYPKCRYLNKASFIQQFKSYEPDILIPELKTAIEYKYIKSQKDNIDDYIDQIKNDATNYTGDDRYENFIAVVYIENTSVATEESIRESWKTKKFPDNWKLVVVNGSPTKIKNGKKTPLKTK